MFVGALLRHLLNTYIVLECSMLIKIEISRKVLSYRDRNGITADQQELNRTIGKWNNSDRYTSYLKFPLPLQ